MELFEFCEEYDCVFTYKYKVGKEIVVKEITFGPAENSNSLVFFVDGVQTDVVFDETDYCACLDVDDLGTEIAKLFIKDNDGGVRMTIQTSNFVVSEDILLDADKNFVIDEEKDEELYIDTSNDCPLFNIQYVNHLDEKDVKELKSMFDDEDMDSICEYINNNDDLLDFIGLWGDDEDKVSYSRRNEDGEIVEEGEIDLNSSSFFDYYKAKIDDCIADKPKYLLFSIGITDNAGYTFAVGKNFNVKNIHFKDLGGMILTNAGMDLDWFGDGQTISIASFHCAGEEFSGDGPESGSGGYTIACYLYEYDAKSEVYKLLKKVGD